MTTGHLHEAICYDSDDHLLAVVLPFLLGGVAAGEPTVVSLGERNTALVRAALPAPAGVTFLTGGGAYGRPAVTIREYRQMLAAYVARGAGRIRVLGELPPEALGATWDWWARYESTVNHAFHEFPLWSMCAYDTRITPGKVLTDVMRTHPQTACPDGTHVFNRIYTDPAVYLMEPREPLADPLQSAEPHADLEHPDGTATREAVRSAGRGVLAPPSADELLLVVSEAVTNARRHGRGAVRVRVWTGPDRVVAAVSDEGRGPRDPFAGLLPPRDPTRGGLGLWLTHLFSDHAVLDRRPDGFTLRLTVGNPHWR